MFYLFLRKSEWLWHLSLGLKWTNQAVEKVITLSHSCSSPAIPVEAVKQNPNVALLITCHGGHIGFLEGLWPRQSTYMDRVFRQFTKAVFENGSSLNDLYWPSLSIPSTAMSKKKISIHFQNEGHRFTWRPGLCFFSLLIYLFYYFSSFTHISLICIHGRELARSIRVSVHPCVHLFVSLLDSYATCMSVYDS